MWIGYQPYLIVPVLMCNPMLGTILPVLMCNPILGKYHNDNPHNADIDHSFDITATNYNNFQ